LLDSAGRRGNCHRGNVQISSVWPSCAWINSCLYLGWGALCL